MSYIGNEPIVSATRTITEITATAGQTVFVANGGYTVGFIDVFVNGAQLQTTDFTASNGSSITLNSGASLGDDIRLVAWGKFSVANSYTQSAADDTFVRRDSSLLNRIINGDMRVDQRASGASVTPTTTGFYNYQTVDRWANIISQASKFTIGQNLNSVTPPAGFTNYLGVQVSASPATVGSTDYFQIAQNIEGYNVADLNWGTANAKPVTLSFWVYSSLTGTFGGVVGNNASVSYVFSYSIPVANTWTQISITIPGPTSTFGGSTTNGVGLNLRFSLGMGTTYQNTAGSWLSGTYFAPTGSVNLVANANATFYITGVDLRKGSYSTAPTFDMRSYGTELNLCQRYYEVFGASLSGMSRAGTAPGASFTYSYKVTKRANPTLGLTGNFGILIPNVGTYTVTSILAANITTNSGVFFDVNTSTTTGAFNYYICAYDGTDKFTLSAEL